MKTFASKIFLKEASTKDQGGVKQNQTLTQQSISVYPVNIPVIQRETICPCDGGCPRCLPVQAKLKIGKPNDNYEQEADRVADQVMRMEEPDISNVKGEMSNVKIKNNTLQRQPEESYLESEEEELIQPKPIADQITPLVQGEDGGRA